MELHKIALRVLFSYLFLLLILRFSGKRTVAEGSTFDFVLALILGDTIDNAMWGEIPLPQFVVAAGTLVVMQLLISFASYRSAALRVILEGTPVRFLHNGRPIRAGLRRERISMRESEEMIRIGEGIERKRWKLVKTASVEQCGKPSVMLHEWARPAQRRDKGLLRKRREP